MPSEPLPGTTMHLCGLASKNATFSAALVFSLFASNLGGCDPIATRSYPGEARATIHGYVDGAGLQDPRELVPTLLWLSRRDADEIVNPPNCLLDVDTLASAECIAQCKAAAETVACTPDESMRLRSCSKMCGAHDISILIDFLPISQRSAGQSLDHTASFPSRYVAQIYDLPPDDALVSFGDFEAKAAIGLLAMMEPDADTEIDWDRARAEHAGPASIRGLAQAQAILYADSPIGETSMWGRILGGSYSEGFHLLELVDRRRCPHSSSGGPKCGWMTTFRPTRADLASDMNLQAGGQLIWPQFLEELNASSKRHRNENQVR